MKKLYHYLFIGALFLSSLIHCRAYDFNNPPVFEEIDIQLWEIFFTSDQKPEEFLSLNYSGIQSEASYHDLVQKLSKVRFWYDPQNPPPPDIKERMLSNFYRDMKDFFKTINWRTIKYSTTDYISFSTISSDTFLDRLKADNLGIEEMYGWKFFEPKVHEIYEEPEKSLIPVLLENLISSRARLALHFYILRIYWAYDEIQLDKDVKRAFFEKLAMKYFKDEHEVGQFYWGTDDKFYDCLSSIEKQEALRLINNDDFHFGNFRNHLFKNDISLFEELYGSSLDAVTYAKLGIVEFFIRNDELNDKELKESMEEALRVENIKLYEFLSERFNNNSISVASSMYEKQTFLDRLYYYPKYSIVTSQNNTRLLDVWESLGGNIKNSISEDGWTALHNSVVNSNTKMLKHLLNKGLNIDAKTKDGMTPLMMACHRGMVENVRILLSAGANHSLKNNQGDKAEELARMWNKSSTSDDWNKMRKYKEDLIVALIESYK